MQPACHRTSSYAGCAAAPPACLQVSVENEKITFIETVNPAATGAVERWLLDVESDIRRTLHKVAGDALEAYPRNERSKWILEWPGQLVLNCSQVYWTKDVNDAIQRAGSKGLAAYADKCTLELNKIVNLVRGQLSSLERATCGALVVIDVHARDVTASMAKEGVEDIRDFKWESQMRYYWEFSEVPPSGEAGRGGTPVTRCSRTGAMVRQAQRCA